MITTILTILGTLGFLLFILPYIAGAIQFNKFFNKTVKPYTLHKVFLNKPKNGFTAIVYQITPDSKPIHRGSYGAWSELLSPSIVNHGEVVELTVVPDYHNADIIVTFPLLFPQAHGPISVIVHDHITKTQFK